MIKFCCYYCKHFKGDDCSKDHLTCYNAMGGLKYMDVCRVVDGVCNEKFDNGRIAVTEAHKDCWEAQDG